MSSKDSLDDSDSDDDVEIEDFILKGNMKKRGQKGNFFTGKRPVQVRFFVLDSAKMKLSYVSSSKKDDGAQVIDLKNVTYVGDSKDEEDPDGWFQVSIPTRTYDFYSHATDPKLKSDQHDSYSSSRWIGGIRTAVRGYFKKISARGRDVVFAQFVDVFTSKAGYVSDSVKWEKQLIELTQTDWTMHRNFLQVSLNEIGNILIRPFETLGTSELYFDTLEKKYGFRMESSEANRWKKYIHESQQGLGILKSGILDKQHIGKSKWSQRRIILTKKGLSHSRIDRDKEPQLMPIREITRVGKEKAPGSFYVRCPNLYKVKKGKEIAHFRILNVEKIGKKEANRQRDEWVKLLQTQIEMAKSDDYDATDDSMKTSSSTSSSSVHEFAIVSGVQQMDNLDVDDDVEPGEMGTLFLSKSDGNIIFTSSKNKSIHGGMSAVKNVSEVIDTFEKLKDLVEKDGSSSSSRLSHRGSSSNSNGTSDAFSKSDLFLRLLSSGEAGDLQSHIMHSNSRADCQRLRGVLSQIVAASKKQIALKTLSDSLRDTRAIIRDRRERKGSRGALYCNYYKVSRALSDAIKTVDTLEAEFTIETVKYVYAKKEKNQNDFTSDSVRKVILDKMEDRGHVSKSLMNFVSGKEDIVIVNRVMSYSDDTLKALHEEQLDRERCNLESENDMRIRLDRMKDSALRQIVFPVLDALADRILNSRNDSYGGDEDDDDENMPSNKVPSGICEIILSLDSVERARDYFIDILMNDYDEKYCRSRSTTGISDWDARYNYFGVVARSLYYEDDDFHLFNEEWLVTPIYAKRFVKMSKTFLQEILSKNEGSQSDDFLRSIFRAAKESQKFEEKLNDMFMYLDDLEKVPGDSDDEYSDFKGQLLQFFSPHLVVLFEAKFKNLAEFISTKSKQSADDCPVVEKFFRDKLEIMEVLRKDLNLVMALGPGKPLIRAMEILVFTPENKSDTRPRGALHEYADALYSRMPGSRTDTKADDIVNDTVFVVYNTAAALCNDVNRMGIEVGERIMEQYEDRDEISTFGIEAKLSEITSKARERIIDMILADVMDFMQNKTFVEAFYDSEAQNYHIAPLKNRITRHVAAVKETLQHSSIHFLSFCTGLAVKLPELYMKFIANNIAPLSSNSASQALTDLEQWQPYLKQLPTKNDGITAKAQRNHDEAMKSRNGERRLKTHCKIIEEKTSEMIKVLRVSQAVAKQGYRGLRSILRKDFPQKTKWLDEGLESEMTQSETRKAKESMKPIIEVVLMMNKISDKRRKHVLFDLEMLGMNDITQQLEIEVTALKKPVHIDQHTKLAYAVHIEFMGFTYTLLKSDNHFKRLIEYIKKFQNPDVVIPPEKNRFSFGSFTKTKEQRNAKHFTKFLRTISIYLCIPQFWSFVECTTPEFKAHVIGRDDDTTNESLSAKRKVMVDYRVHVTHNNAFRFAHIPRSRFMVLHKRLQQHAKQTGMKKGAIPPLDRRTPMTREGMDEERDQLQKLLSLAVETFGHNHKNMTMFFGKKICKLLSIGNVSPMQSTGTKKTYSVIR